MKKNNAWRPKGWVNSENKDFEKGASALVESLKKEGNRKDFIVWLFDKDDKEGEPALK